MVARGRVLNLVNKNISVVIAAKNEEKNLFELFKYLSKLNYPVDNFEIIFVNDQSADNTKNVIEEFIKVTPNAKLYDSFGKKYPGKKGALDIGISHARNDYIMITDADCEPMPNWLSAFSEMFNKGYDFLFGIAPYYQTNNFINKIATFENLRTHILTFVFTKLGLPFSAAARSFSFSKKAFKKVEGYKNTTETLSGDDDLLLREAIKNNLKIGIVENSDAFVYSNTKQSWKEYLTQKARHASTSNYLLLKQKIALGVWHLINLGLLFTFFLGLAESLFLIPFFLKVIFDIGIVQFSQTKFGYKFSIAESIYLQIIYEFLLVVNYLRGTFGAVKWK